MGRFLYWVAVAVLASLGILGISSGIMLGWIPLIVSGVLLGGYTDRKNGGDVAYRAKAAGVSKKEIRANDARIDREHQITVALVEKFSLPSNRNEPLPPWIEYPGFSPYHIFWRMGVGESYLSDPFGPFMTALDKREREQYFARYDLGEQWPHRRQWYDGWVEEEY